MKKRVGVHGNLRPFCVYGYWMESFKRKAKGYPAQGQQQNYRSEQDKRATIMMIAARLL